MADEQVIHIGQEHIGTAYHFEPVIFVDAPLFYGKKEQAPPDRPHHHGWWSHCWTDDGFENELTAFCGALGLRADYGQYGGAVKKYHFDLRPRKYKLALAGGAVERPLQDWIESTTSGGVPRALRLTQLGVAYQFDRPVGQRTVLKVLRGAVHATVENGISLLDTLTAPTRKEFFPTRFPNEPLLVSTWDAQTVIEVTNRRIR